VNPLRFLGIIARVAVPAIALASFVGVFMHVCGFSSDR